MPLYWTIDSKERLFTGVAEGEVTFGDAVALLEALEGAKALSYRKLFDGRGARSVMTEEELLALCAKIREYDQQGEPLGALAMVTTREQIATIGRLLGALAAANRPMKLCNNLRQARIWLSDQARPNDAT